MALPVCLNVQALGCKFKLGCPQTAADKIDRCCVCRWQAITADAMDADEDEEAVETAPPPEPAPSTRRTKDASSTKHKRRQQVCLHAHE